MIHLSLKKWEDSETEGKKKKTQKTNAFPKHWSPRARGQLPPCLTQVRVSHLSKPTLGSLNLDFEKILSNISQQLEETLAKSHLQTFAEKTYTSSRMFLVPLSPSHVFWLNLLKTSHKSKGVCVCTHASVRSWKLQKSSSGWTLRKSGQLHSHPWDKWVQGHDCALRWLNYMSFTHAYNCTLWNTMLHRAFYSLPQLPK